MLSMLQDVIRDYDGFVELRFHAKTFQTLSVAQGKLDSSTVRHRNGVGVRVLEGGTWGFASTGECTPSAVRAAVEQARLGARASAGCRALRIDNLPEVTLARGEFVAPGVEDVLGRTLEEKLQLAIETEARARSASQHVPTASCRYSEIFEEKAIVTTDGAAASFKLVRPEFRVSVVAERSGERSSSM